MSQLNVDILAASLAGAAEWWVDRLVADIEALRAELHDAGIDRVVLAGTGGSSLAPEVICATDQVALTVLDTTDPGPANPALRLAAVLAAGHAGGAEKVILADSDSGVHSTGQYQKGGHQNGAFLQLTGAVGTDIPVPGNGFTLGELQRAQALGDAGVLAAHGRPVLRLHLQDRPAGLVSLVHALQERP